MLPCLDFLLWLYFLFNCAILLPLCVHKQLVMLVGVKLQHVIATLALENAGITGFFSGAKLTPRNELFWFNKPELLLSLIHFILFQVGKSWSMSCANIFYLKFVIFLLDSNACLSVFFFAECIRIGFILLVLGTSSSIFKTQN